MGKKQPKQKQQKEKVVLTAFQIKERKERTVFVGNVPLDSKPEHIKALFTKELGDCVETVWFRSLPTTSEEDTMKVPHRAKIITK
jgi:nucleolar protein 12